MIAVVHREFRLDQCDGENLAMPLLGRRPSEHSGQVAIVRPIRHPNSRKDTVMLLTDTRIRNAKPQAKAYKLSDGGSMYLLVKPDGGRYWRLDYRFSVKRRTLACVYPITTLSSARTQRDEARRLLARDIDPSATKKARKRAARIARGTTFESIAREWMANQRHRLAHRYSALILARLEADYFRRLDRDQSRKSMRQNCWTRCEKWKSAP